MKPNDRTFTADQVRLIGPEGEQMDVVPLAKARELAQIDIDSALLYCYDQTLTELVARGKLIHSDTIAAYNDMIRQGVSWRDK